MSIRGLILLCSVAAALLMPRLVLAQPDLEAELKRRGDAQFDEQKFAEALELYEKAYAAHADPSLLYNQARALEAMGEYPRALEKLDRFKATAPPSLIAKVQGLDTLFAELRPRVSTLTVRTNVDHAELFVRGKTLGEMGRERTITTRAGSAEVEVRAEGFASAHQNVELPGGAVTALELVLSPRSARGTLSVATRPGGAEVWLDDRPLGPTPLETEVATGAHVVVLRKDGYADERVPLSVGASERRTVDVTLEQHRPLLSRWYFWAGVGLVVATVVVGAALLAEKPAQKGTFTPQQVRAPLTVAF